MDLQAIRDIQPWFNNTDSSEGPSLLSNQPWPRFYDRFSPRLAPGAVRLVVVPFDRVPSITTQVAALTRSFLELLPDDIQVGGCRVAACAAAAARAVSQRAADVRSCAFRRQSAGQKLVPAAILLPSGLGVDVGGFVCLSLLGTWSKCPSPQ